VIRLAPVFVLVLVTTLLLVYGAHSWSWLAGPVAALAVWSLDRMAPAPSGRAIRGPAPVD
jgi:hypothetical protein